MSTEANKALVRRYYEDVLHQGNIQLLEKITVPDYDEHDPIPGQASGQEGLKQRVGLLRSAFQPQFTLEDMIAEGDKVVVRWTNRGTHVGEFMGIPATGRSFSIAGIDIHRLRDGTEIGRFPPRHAVQDPSVRAALGTIERRLGHLRAMYDDLMQRGELRRCACGKPECDIYFISGRAAIAMDSLRLAILEEFRPIYPEFTVFLGPPEFQIP